MFHLSCSFGPLWGVLLVGYGSLQLLMGFFELTTQLKQLNDFMENQVYVV